MAVLGPGIRHREGIITRPGPLIGNLISPGASLEIEIFQVGEGTGGKERMTDVLDGAFDSPFLITAGRPARPRSEVVMRAQFQQAWMKVDRITMPLKDHRSQVIVDHGPGHGPHSVKALTCPRSRLSRLWSREFEIERPAVGERQHEAGEAAPGASDAEFSERGPIGLRLLAR